MNRKEMLNTLEAVVLEQFELLDFMKENYQRNTKLAELELERYICSMSIKRDIKEKESKDYDKCIGHIKQILLSQKNKLDFVKSRDLDKTTFSIMLLQYLMDTPIRELYIDKPEVISILDKLLDVKYGSINEFVSSVNSKKNVDYDYKNLVNKIAENFAEIEFIDRGQIIENPNLKGFIRMVLSKENERSVILKEGKKQKYIRDIDQIANNLFEDTQDYFNGGEEKLANRNTQDFISDSVYEEVID